MDNKMFNYPYYINTADNICQMLSNVELKKKESKYGNKINWCKKKSRNIF